MACEWSQLAWAAVTVGKAYGEEHAFGVFSSFERIHRETMLYAYLRETDTGSIVRAQTYDAADPTEKGNISYSIGMTLAKLYAELYLATPRLLHFANHVGNHVITTAPGNSRPDLIGTSGTGDWVVLEAKGSSGVLKAGVIATAKTCAPLIVSIWADWDHCAPWVVQPILRLPACVS